MNGSNMIFIVIGAIWSFTLFRSILIMIAGKGIFKKAAKNEKTALYPILNLFTMLEICEINTFWGILLFVPILNIIVLLMMSYKLGVVFNTNTGFQIGLVVFPLMFYLLLSVGNKPYKLSDEEYFKAMDKIKEKNINLMTDEEIQIELSKLPEEENNDVDSIFKSNIQMMEQVEPYKAAKIDILGMEKLKNHVSDDDPTLRDLGFGPKNDTTKEKKEEKKDDLEIVDL